jgi:hypothetical protein
MVFIFLALVSFGASPQVEYPVAKEEYSFVLKVRDFYGAEGYGFDYFLDKDSLTVVLWDDVGGPKREILSRRLTLEEASFWSKYLAIFPVKRLKQKYSDDRVSDGMQQFFTFKTGAGEKNVTVRNVQVKELMDLCQNLNNLLPDKMKMRGGKQR